MKNLLLMCLSALLLMTAGKLMVIEKSYPKSWNSFEFDEPAAGALTAKHALWATWYWTPSFTSNGGVPLVDAHDQPLGPVLAEEQYCHAAVEGAVRVDGTVYTFADTGKRKLADCSAYEPDMPQAPYVRFHRSASPFGEGEPGYFLVPYRTIAVDPKVIPLGSLVYVPEARGNRVTLPDGTQALHDGYFLAGDTGYGVADNHIDVFIGISDKNPFPWVVSEPKATFTAYVVQDDRIKAKLMAAHRATNSQPGQGSQNAPIMAF